MSEGDPPHFRQVAICGVGLLGGSLGLALRRGALAGRVVGVGRNPTKLERAIQAGAIDRYTLDLEEGCKDSDLIVLCGPVSIIMEQLPVVMRCAPAGAVVTDVGSTKASIVRAAMDCVPSEARFVGSHPIAGSEKSGVDHAREDLYRGATCVVTPPKSGADVDALRVVEGLWRSVGMRIVRLDPERHDQVLAMVSHLPHLVASALVAQVDEQIAEEEVADIQSVAGPGFADTTRIAMGSVPMWLDIFTDNKDALLASVDVMSQVLADVRRAIAEDDRESISEFLERAARLRKELDARKNSSAR